MFEIIDLIDSNSNVVHCVDCNGTKDLILLTDYVNTAVFMCDSCINEHLKKRGDRHE